MKTIKLTPEAEGVLVVELNILLRDMKMAMFMSTALNDVFKQITGFDHDSHERRVAQQRQAG